MNKEIRNPLFTGLINVFIPGVSHLYVSRDWYRFIGAVFINAFVFMVTLSTGAIAQDAPRASLPPGVCTGILVTFFVAGMFASGYNLARKNNEAIRAFM